MPVRVTGWRGRFTQMSTHLVSLIATTLPSSNPPRPTMHLSSLLDCSPASYQLRSNAPGPAGSLPLTPEMLLDSPSGDIFGMTQNAGMGWDPNQLLRDQVLILSTMGGIRAEDGHPIALGYHTGHWEVGLLMQAAARELDRLERLPFAAYVSDPCDGRSQGTTAMMDSLPYRNDAAVVLKRLIRSLPHRQAVIGVATCDKGLPAMMLALAGQKHLPSIIVPGGVTLPPNDGEDAGKAQAIGARYAHGEIDLKYAADMGCRACGSPGGGCQFFGTAATAQAVAEALGMSLPHSALSPSGAAVWKEIAVQSARAVVALADAKKSLADILTADAVHNAMVVHAAMGGSTNLLIHIPAIAFEAGLKRPQVDDWNKVNRLVPRIVDVLPNGPVGHPTVRVFLAGGVPEVMLHLRALGLLKLDVLTAAGARLGDLLEWWEKSERRARFKELLKEQDGIDPDDVIMAPAKAKSRGMTSTMTFPVGNLAPEGSVIKSTAIDPSVVDADGVYRKIGPARVFTSEPDAIAAIKGRRGVPVKEGDVLVLMCRGPLGSGMEETYQITSALKYLPFGKHVAVITDARFSGVSTGACIGHVGPEALAGGPIGKVKDGDLIEIIVDRIGLTGTINLVGDGSRRITPEEGAKLLAERKPSVPLQPDPQMPSDTLLWAMLQKAGGGTWGGCVYDTAAIARVLDAGYKALG